MATIQNLQVQIDALGESINVLQNRIKTAQEQLNTSNWGTQKVAEAQAIIEKLQLTLSKKMGQQQSLISEQNVTQLNSINLAIDTLTTKLAALTSKKTSIVNIDAPGETAKLIDIQNEIAKTSAALKSFESRKLNETARVNSPTIGMARLDTYTKNLPPNVSTISEATSQNIQMIQEDAIKTNGILDKMAQMKEAKIISNAHEIAKAYLEAAKIEQDAVTGVVHGPDSPPNMPVSDETWGADQKLADAKEKEAKAAAAAAAANKIHNDTLLAEAKAAAEANPALMARYELLKKLAAENQKIQITQYTNGGAEQIRATNTVGGVSQVTKVGVLNDGSIQSEIPRAYQSFTQGVVRDIRELTKWSLAISVIYAPINTLSTLMQKMVENEVKLAQVSVIVNSAVATTGQVFDMASQAAQNAGEDIGLVIDAFGQAYQAAGRIGNATERLITTQKLLSDSLILSKISTLDQKQAIDTLSAALYQSNNKLSDGSTLLDQWVHVSKIAAVDVATLAQGVAILGDSAETAGLGTKELNAMIATMSEVSLQTGPGVANAAKALIGSYQSPEAIKALGNIGIAVKDTTGQTRDFISVMQDVANLRKAGILSDPEFSSLTLLIGGGGIRRQKDVAAFIENMGRYQQLAASQENVGGESATALDQQLGTVQTALTRLGNAFQSLGNSIGTEGGLLSDFATLVDLGAKLVEVLDKVTASMGKAGPLLIGLGIAAAFLGPNKMNSIAGGMFSGMTPRLSQTITGVNSETGAIQSSTIRGNAMNRYLGSAAAIAIPAISNVTQGDYKEAGANIAGGITGALLTGGNPIGAIIGSAIAEAFVRSTLDYKTQFANFFTGSIADAQKAQPAQKTQQQELMSEAFKSLGYGNESLGKFLVKADQLLSLRQEKGAPAYATPEAMAMAELQKQNPQLAAQIQQQGAPTPLAAATRTLATDAQVTQLNKLQSDRQNELRQQLNVGTITPAQYTTQFQNLTSFAAIATRYMAAFGQEFKKLDPSIKSASDEYKAFLDITTYGSQEQKDSINANIGEMEKLQDAIDKLKQGETKVEIGIDVNGQPITIGIEDAKKQIEDLKQSAAAQAVQINLQALTANIKLPPIVDLTGKGAPLPIADANTAYAEGKRQMEQRLIDSGQFNDKNGKLDIEKLRAYEDQIGEFSMLVLEAGKIIWKTFSGLDQSFLQKGYQTGVDTGKIKQQGNMQIQQVDLMSSQKGQLESQVAAATAYIQKHFPNYQLKPEDIGIMFKDYGTDILHADNLAVKLALQRIADINQKQLDGIYNMPDGATFWVPLSAALLKPKGNGGFGDLGAVPPSTTPTPTVSPEVQSYLDYMMRLRNEPISGGRFAKNAHPPYDYTAADAFKVPEPTRITPETAQMYGDRFDKMQSTPKPTGIDGILEAIKQFFSTLTPSAIQQQIDPNKKMQFDSAIPNIGEEVQTWLHNLLGTISSSIGGLGGTPGIGATGSAGFDKMRNDNAQQPITTRLDIQINSNTMLTVDGRILADIVKQYLSADMLQSQQGSSSSTRRYVL